MHHHDYYYTYDQICLVGYEANKRNIFNLNLMTQLENRNDEELQLVTEVINEAVKKNKRVLCFNIQRQIVGDKYWRYMEARCVLCNVTPFLSASRFYFLVF